MTFWLKTAFSILRRERWELLEGTLLALGAFRSGGSGEVGSGGGLERVLVRAPFVFFLVA